MTMKVKLTAIAAILSAVAEEGKGAVVPLGPIYMAVQSALDITFDDWHEVVALLAQQKWAHVTPETIRLTDTGLALAAEIDAVLPSQGAQS